MGYPSERPRCLVPMQPSSQTEDPDPVCWRPKGHDTRTPATRASLRHLSRVAYLNELARSRRNRGNYR